MAFKGFLTRLLLRTCLMALVLSAAVFLFISSSLTGLSLLLFLVVLIQIWEISYYVTSTNRKLTRFLESIRYSDFITGFSSDNKLGSSFKDLNSAFNDVLDAFRKARSEKEEHLQYLHIVVEHINVGVFSFDEEGNVGLMNAAAKKLLEVNNLRNIEDLIAENSRLYKVLFDLPAGKSALFRTKEDIQLSINATEVRLAGKQYKLVAIQNIQPELQKKELEAWQNLTRILRHEIMNSITPISSLTSTMKDIITEETEKVGDNVIMPSDSASDLQEGLITIEDRSKGLIKFINAFRDYTTIPAPDIKPLSVKKLYEDVVQLMKAELKSGNIEVAIEVNPAGLIVNADEEQILQVLINIVKNGIEALTDRKNPKIILIGRFLNQKDIVLQVRDNGPGIIREAYEKIFIPFYTTKKTGSGIGLAWSRQIMQQHHGTISVESEPDSYTLFTLKF